MVQLGTEGIAQVRDRTRRSAIPSQEDCLERPRRQFQWWRRSEHIYGEAWLSCGCAAAVSAGGSINSVPLGAGPQPVPRGSVGWRVWGESSDLESLYPAQ